MSKGGKMTTNEFLKIFNLPTTFHEILHLAVQSLIIIKNSKHKYIVNHSEWHTFDKYDSSCSVCFAGAFLAHRFCFPYNMTFDLSNLPTPLKPYAKPLKNLLESIDSFRLRQYLSAITKFYELETPRKEIRKITDLLYEHDFKNSTELNPFWQSFIIENYIDKVEEMINILKKNNL